MKIDEVKVGDFLELDDLVGIELDEDMPENSHVAVWFGLETQKRIS